MAYSEHNRLLCAGTSKGYILFWRQCSVQAGETSAEDWQPLLHATTKLQYPIDDLRWAVGHGLLAAQTEMSCSILIEHDLHRKVRDGCALVQLSNIHLGFANVERKRDERGACEPDLEPAHVRAFWAGSEPGELKEIKSSVPIKGCDCNGKVIVMWSGRKAEVHQIDLETGAHSLLSTFDTTASNIVVSSDHESAYLYMAVEGKIEVANLQGNVTRSLPLGETEGNAHLLDIHGAHLVSTSTRGIIRLWDLSKTKPVSVGKPRPFETDRHGKLGQMTSVRINKSGTRISILARHPPSVQVSCPRCSARLRVASSCRSVWLALDARVACSSCITMSRDPQARTLRAPHDMAASLVAQSTSLPDTNVYVYDVEEDRFMVYDCGPTHYPVSHAWDLTDDRLLACEVRRMHEARQSATEVNVKLNKTEVCFFFATGNNGLQLQHRLPLDADGAALLGIHVPHVFVSSPKESHSSAMVVTAPVMRDFVGMECENTETRMALLNFSYNMTIGNMDDAYKSVKLIKSKNLWEVLCLSLAHTRVHAHSRACGLTRGRARTEHGAHVCKDRAAGCGGAVSCQDGQRRWGACSERGQGA